MIIDELKKMESALLEGQEAEKLDQLLSEEAFDKLGLSDVIEVGYYLNHLLWHAFEHNKSYTHLTERVDSCCEYIVNRFAPGDFDSVDLIEFWITMATMTFELTYQYEKVQSIMQWVLSTASKTKKQSVIALQYLSASQVVSSADRKIYKKMLSDIQTSEAGWQEE